VVAASCAPSSGGTRVAHADDVTKLPKKTKPAKLILTKNDLVAVRGGGGFVKSLNSGIVKAE